MKPTQLQIKVVPLLVLAALTGWWGSTFETRETTTVVPPENPKVAKLKLAPGFRAEHLYSPTDDSTGSWVSMTFDDQGRLLASDQYGALYRLTLPPIGTTTRPRVERVPFDLAEAVGTDPTKPGLEMGHAQGLLWAFNSLYVMVNHKPNAAFSRGSGLYRLQDTDGDDQFDKISLLKELRGEGEHGPHSIKLAPDGKSLYVIAGNHTDVPEMDAYRLPKVWKEDNLFPLIKDPRGHAITRTAPGGWIANLDPEGRRWELVSAGFRNAFDLAFNEAGDLFVYDSDMEWDFGLPWYRPTRICHATSGSEFGWRTGSGKWSPTFPDNLPAVLNIGQGSPTNLIYVDHGRFPERYRNTLLAFDWSFGIIHALHLKPEGATYAAKHDEFLSGLSLPLTDGVIGPDGALYFLTGGRRLDSDLYRVYYDGPEKRLTPQPAPALTDLHRLRRSLEAFHGEPDPAALAIAWPQLGHPDRFIRYAARVAVEHQPVGAWQERVLAESEPRALAQAAVALAHQGDSATALSTRLTAALLVANPTRLAEPERLDLLRALELTWLRMGLPDADGRERVGAYLDAQYPAPTNDLNRALSKLLVALDHPNAAAKTVALLEKNEVRQAAGGPTAFASQDLILRNPAYGLDIARMLDKMPPAQQTYYALALSGLQSGWTPDLRERYFDWFRKAFGYQGGRSYIGFVDRARRRALNRVPDLDRAAYAERSGESLLTSSGNDLAGAVAPKGPGRTWKVPDALAVAESGLTGRNFANGKNLYAAVACKTCHAMRGEGGNIGPDLTQVGTRFSNKDLLEAIILPSKAVSDQYAATEFKLKTGETVVGRIASEDAKAYQISQNPFAPDYLRELLKKDVASSTNATVSVMLPGLINALNPEELKDLLAYLKSGGDEKHAVFAPNAAPNSTNKSGKK
jgi:putative heme-binding domain-containing protein